MLREKSLDDPSNKLLQVEGDYLRCCVTYNMTVFERCTALYVLSRSMFIGDQFSPKRTNIYTIA